MKWWLVWLLAGCDQLFGFQHVPPGPDAPDAAVPGQWATISTGARHACGLDLDHHLVCLGEAVGGAITPTRLPDDTWTAVSAGGRHTCAIHAGKVACWGDNQFDESLGTNVPPTVALPTDVTFPPGAPATFDSVSAGPHHSCALGGGQAWCWGTAAQVGGTQGGPNLQTTAVPLAAISVGFDQTCALDGSGGVWCWGANDNGQVTGAVTPTVLAPVQVTLPAKATAVTAGRAASCAILDPGQLWCWGNAAAIGLPANTVTAPVLVSSASWTAIAMGNHSVCASGGGQAACWGLAYAGGLADGVWQESARATDPLHPFAADSVSLAISTEDDESGCAISNANAYCWGENRGGQLGVPATLHFAPVVIAGTWTSVAMQQTHVCATTGSGAVQCWGDDVATPAAAPGTGVQRLIVGDDYACGQTGDAIQCWGSNTNGELGDPSATSQSSFTLAGTTEIAGGASGTCALSATGQLCWGWIGGAPTKTPAAPGGVPALIDVGSTADASCGITTMNQCGCWGQNVHGELGDGVDNPNPTPQPFQVYKDDTYKAIAMTGQHACAVTVSGGVSCWGSNYNWESAPFAPNAIINITPVQDTAHSALAGCTAIAAGFSTSCAICNGAPTCWGLAVFGRVGTGVELPNQTAAVAVAVPPGRTWTHVAVGAAVGCARASDGTLACWGFDVRGEVGDGSHGSAMPLILPAPP